MRKFMILLSKPIFAGGISTLILALTIFVYTISAEYLPLALAALLFLNFVSVYAGQRQSKKQYSLKISDILNVMVSSIWGFLGRIRSNVMLHNPKSNELSIVYSHNMDGCRDRYLRLAVGKGCAGKAFETGRTHVVDLNVAKHEDYLISREDVWEKMRAVLSVPIFAVGKTHKIIGILSVDTNQPLRNVKFNTNTVQERVILFADIIASLLAQE